MRHSGERLLQDTPIAASEQGEKIVQVLADGGMRRVGERPVEPDRADPGAKMPLPFSSMNPVPAPQALSPLSRSPEEVSHVV